MIMTPKSYAAHFSLHINTVHRLLKSGKIPNARKIGKSWRIEVKLT